MMDWLLYISVGIFIGTLISGVSMWRHFNKTADEIERLREALKRIADYEGGPVDLIWLGMAEIARSALQQKESE